MHTLWIGLGGALGSMARYQLDGFVQRKLGTALPFGTFTVNVVGSFLLSLLMHVSLRGDLISPAMRLALATGVLGGFTTYSSFNYETLRLLQGGAWLAALVNLGGTVLGCLAAGLLGWGLGRLVIGG